MSFPHDLKFFPCDCGCHAVAFYGDDLDSYVSFSWWTDIGDPPFWQRLKAAWQVLKWGRTSCAEVLFNREAAIGFVKFITAEIDQLPDAEEDDG